MYLILCCSMFSVASCKLLLCVSPTARMWCLCCDMFQHVMLPSLSYNVLKFYSVVVLYFVSQNLPNCASSCVLLVCFSTALASLSFSHSAYLLSCFLFLLCCFLLLIVLPTLLSHINCLLP